MIVTYIATHDPIAARALYDAYDPALVILRAHPEVGRRYVPDHAALGNVRMLPIPGFADYLIFSRYDGDTIKVIRA